MNGGDTMASQISDVKITVLRCFSPEEVFKKPPVKARYSGPCDIFEVGQVFHISTTEDPTMPDNFCLYAWDAIFRWFVEIRSKADFLQWYEEPGVVIVCCPDGLRPVVFKIERAS